MARDLQSLFTESLHPLGDDDPRWRAIHTPVSERGAARTGVTAQFLENAADYDAHYANVDRFRVLIERHLAPPAPRSGALAILDVGSGSGNSVIPLLDLWPDAFVLATDVSPQLLAILRDRLEREDRYRGRYGLVCMDANHACLTPGAFDAAVGAAILHHIVDPLRVLQSCATALAPGGVALFIEPFEPGYALLRMAYRRILAEAARRGAAGPGFEMLARMVLDHEARMRDKSDPIYEVLDDKWFFTRTYFEHAARHPQWRSCRVEDIHEEAMPLLGAARTELQLSGLDPTALPQWAWDEIESFEASFSREAKRDLLLEAVVRFERSATAPALAREGCKRGWWWNPAESGRGFFVEWEDGTPCAIACAYAADGNAEWSALDSRALRATPRADRLTVELGECAVTIEPQHPEAPADSRTGRWGEVHGDSTIVVELLGTRMMAALLDPRGWSLVVAESHGDRFEGEWLRFCGGQTLAGAYRAPAPPRSLGRALLSWIDGECLVVRGPDGTARMYAPRLKTD